MNPHHYSCLMNKSTHIARCQCQDYTWSLKVNLCNLCLVACRHEDKNDFDGEYQLWINLLETLPLNLTEVLARWRTKCNLGGETLHFGASFVHCIQIWGPEISFWDFCTCIHTLKYAFSKCSHYKFFKTDVINQLSECSMHTHISYQLVANAITHLLVVFNEVADHCHKYKCVN